MVRGLGLSVVTVALAVATGASAADAATFTVTRTDDRPGASCSGTTCTSLRAAVAAVDQVQNVGSTISLGNTTYSLGGSGGVAAPLSLSLDTTITGAGHTATKIKQLSAGNGVIQISAPTASVRLSKLTITGGDAVGTAGTSVNSGPGDGGDGGDAAGGILDRGALTLNDVAVTNNSAQGGIGGQTIAAHAGTGGTAVGGILVTGSLSLQNSIVEDNVAVGGKGGPSDDSNGGQGGSAIGGIAVEPGAGTLPIVASQLSGNHATGGGGGDSFEGPSASFGNGGRADGALAVLSSAAASVIGSRIDQNIATGGVGGSLPSNGTHGGIGGFAEGGGIYAAGGQLTIIDTELDGNKATGASGGASPTGSGAGGGALGGALAVLSPASLVLHRATLALNTAESGDGGPTPTGAIATTGASGVDAQGGGAYITGTSALVDATIAENTATGSAGAAASGGTTAGANGRGIGGGISVQGGTLQLISDTFSDNAALAPPSGLTYGGDFDDGDVPVTVEHTIFAGGFAMAPYGTCAIFGSQYTDGGHNLEYPGTTSCQLTAASDVHQNPQLAQLTNHGGRGGPTLALAATSPARHAGGACTDPSQSASPPLRVDERGQPRHSPCDIGAYETQPPSVIRAPALTSPAVVGTAIGCPTSGFSGDQPLSFAFSWLTDGHVIAGAASSSYKPVKRDTGHHLACTVRASNVYGSASATSKAVPVMRLTGAKLVSSKLIDDGKGHVLVTLACPASTPGGSCRVAISLYRASGKRTRLAGGQAMIAAGKRRLMKLKLTKAGRRATKHLPLSVHAVLTTHDTLGGAVTHTSSASVHRAKHKRHR